MTLNRYSTGWGIVLAVAISLLMGGQAAAQSTIFNIPSTDVVAKGKKYFEFDFISHLESHNNGGFQAYVPRLVVGLGKGVEAGVNFSAADSANPTAVYVQPNLKWQFYAKEETGMAMTVGAIAYLPVKNRDPIPGTSFGGFDTYGLFYGNLSKKFKGDHGPRVTLGAYGLGGYDFNGLDKGGAVFGYEQPLTKKVSFVVDWLSGENAFGYATPGFSFSLPKSSLLNVGYSFGNFGRKNNGIFLYYGITF